MIEKVPLVVGEVSARGAEATVAGDDSCDEPGVVDFDSEWGSCNIDLYSWLTFSDEAEGITPAVVPKNTTTNGAMAFPILIVPEKNNFDTTYEWSWKVNWIFCTVVQRRPGLSGLQVSAVSSRQYSQLSSPSFELKNPVQVYWLFKLINFFYRERHLQLTVP